MSAPRRARRALALILVGAAVSAAPAARADVTVGGVSLPDTGLFAPVAARWHAAAAALDGASGASRVRALLACGRVDEACSLATAHRGESREWVFAHAQATLARDGVLTAAQTHDLELPAATDTERAIWFAALFGADDGRRVDFATRPSPHAPDTSARLPDLLAAGRLAYDRLDHPTAEARFTRALHLAAGPPSGREGALDPARARAAALNGLALVHQKRRDWDGALQRSIESLAADPGADALETLAQTLIRLGRTDEAVSAVQWAVALAPYHEAAHYLLGNGYTRLDYTQLRAAHPDAFADASGRRALAGADARLARGDRAGARRAYQALAAAHPGWVDAATRLASLDFEDAHFGDAIARCRAVLARRPDYGRAHAILSRALEARRFELDVHRADYEARFAAKAVPVVPGIERFVINWKSLSPRHQKRVALSVAPWAAFLPVLIEGGATFYIKPMSMLLSECPGQEALRDQRIDYDSRLWDDVRGCGGHRTVTGIEDVERTVFDRYDTVIHELTHQVHGVLPADDARAILEHYRAAKTRDEATHEGFLSRYAGGSVWEYLAEGANALDSPKRDAYDPREVVRERLDAIDPALRALVERLLARTDVSASYPVAYVNAGYDRVERGRVDEALPFIRKALARAPAEESAHEALVNTLVLGGRGPEAVAAAARAVEAQPASGGVRIAAAQATWHGGRGLAAAVAGLREARATVRAEDRPALDRALGRLAWVQGDAPLALAAYDSALARQADDPDALRGKASALALAGRWDEGFALARQAVRARTGVVELRCEFARDLLRGGRVDEARLQLDEARLLDPEDPEAEALRGWLDLESGAPDSAVAHAERALRFGPWNDLARIVLGRAHAERGRTDAAREAWAPVHERIARQAPPAYVYRARLSTWDEVHALPAVERALLERWSEGAAGR